MDAALQVFWEQVAVAIPLICVALTPIVIKVLMAAAGWLIDKMQPAVGEAVDEVEEEKTREPNRYTTPVSMRVAAEKKATAKAGFLISSIYPTSLLTKQIERDVAAKKVARTKSGRPLGPGESGEHAINIPRNDMPHIPRPSGEFSGLDMSAIEDEPSDDDA